MVLGEEHSEWQPTTASPLAVTSASPELTVGVLSTDIQWEMRMGGSQGASSRPVWDCGQLGTERLAPGEQPTPTRVCLCWDMQRSSPASALTTPSRPAQTPGKHPVLWAAPCPGGSSPLPGGPSVQLCSGKSGDPPGSLPAA